MTDRNKHTLALPYWRLSDTDFTDTSHASVVPTTTEPAESTAGVVDLQSKQRGWCTDGAHSSDMVMLQPYGSNAANENYAMRVFGWSRVRDVDDTTIDTLWVPTLLAEFTVTLGSIAATDLGTNMFLADTLTLDKGNASLHTLSSPTSDLPAYAIIDPLGARYLQFTFDIDSSGNASASANVLMRGMS